ncbi:TonB-dependent receptor [Sphingobium sp. H33]|uniref:TonB-dependent receptor n=2 Tax=Sphingobium nicotianae TaxID=2782607 RepID=A0A9X1ISZ9_9SPHN|nr:TonB-dependent receptor [Sphingobium nicotianae]
MPPAPVRPPELAGTRSARSGATEPPPLPARRAILRTQAQDDAARAAAATQVGGGDILITGSRLKTSGYDSPVPLTVIDASLIRHLGHGNAADVVRLIPQNIATQSDATAGNGFSADIGAAFANLRGLNPTFGTRTLTLVNSRRFVPTSTGGQVDLNLIPSVLFGRVETVTGGASAAYGSDAVAGVVNIILDNKLEGFKGVVDHGQTARGDGQSFHAAAAHGFKVAGGRGHIVVGAEYQRNRGISRCAQVRSWCAESWGIFVNAAGIQPGTLNTPANISGYNVPGSFGYGAPNYIVDPRSGMIYMSPYGAIRNFTAPASVSTTAFSNIAPAIQPPLAAVDKVFSADGKSVMDYDPGAYGPKNVGGQAQGGDNLSAYSDQAIQTPLERYTSYVSTEYELSDALKLSAELIYAGRRSTAPSIVSATRSTMAIKPDNAFLPPSVVAAMNGASFSLGKDVDNELRNVQRVNAEVFRGVIGLSGKLLANWTWDAYYQYGDSRRHARANYARQNDAFVMAIDAIRDPANPGRIICRPLSPATLATFTPAYQAELQALYASCVPLNLFGIGNMDPAAIAFVWRDVGEDFRYRQHALAGSVQGTLSAGWGAGPIGVAAGIDHRAEQGEVTHGGVNPNAYAGAFGLDYAGRINVTETFVETNVPTLRDFGLGDYLELNGALRYTLNRSSDTLTGQSRSTDAASWKIGAIYDMIDGIRLRATWSRDIRAAGFRELFQKTAPTDEGTIQGRVNNPNIAGPNKNDNTPIFSGGNFGLTAEKADTTTIGTVLTPGFLSGVRVSLDWYQIKVRDAIANLNGQRVTDLCIGYKVLCDRISFASPTDIVRIDAGQANVGKIEIRGFDFEASYRLPLTSLTASLDGTLDVRFLLNHQYDFQVKQSEGIPTINYAGQSGPAVEGGDFYPTPKWMWNALIAYDGPGFNTTMTLRHVGQGILNREWTGPEDAGYAPTLPNSVNINRVPSRTYVNLAVSYELPVGSEDQMIELFGSIENLFDLKPPVAPGGTTTVLVSAYPTNPVFFDTFGMRWKAGVRVQF